MLFFSWALDKTNSVPCKAHSVSGVGFWVVKGKEKSALERKPCSLRSMLRTTSVHLEKLVELCYFLLGPLKFLLCSLPLLGAISLQLLKWSPWIPLCSYSHDPQCFGLDFSPVFSTTGRVVRKFSSVSGFRFPLKTFATCNTSQNLKKTPNLAFELFNQMVLKAQIML